MQIFLWILLAVAAVPVLFFLTVAVSVLFVRGDREYTSDNAYFRCLLKMTVWLIVRCCRIRLHISGLEKLPEGRFLLTGNHLSAFDPLVQWYAMPDKQLAFLSKKENLCIPVFGKLARRCCTRAIDRENPRNALKTIAGAAELIAADAVSVGVYPEGTRSKTGALLPFHNGVFKVAQKANVPIVVAVLQGTEQIRKNAPWRSTDVYLDIADVIPAQEVCARKTAELGERVRESILEICEKMR